MRLVYVYFRSYPPVLLDMVTCPTFSAQAEWYAGGDWDSRFCTIEAAREDYGIRVPPPRYTWDDVIAKHNGGMRS